MINTPYVNRKLRHVIELAGLRAFIKNIEELTDSEIKNREELTACITYIVFRLIKHFYSEGNWYNKMDAVKVVESAIDEYKRRVIHPYEDKKIQEHGDIE